MKKNQWKIGIAAIVALSTIGGIKYVGAQWNLHELTQVHHRDRGPRLPQDPATQARWDSFTAIWNARNTRDITDEINPFLSDPFQPLRVRAAQALGELENPKAVAPLQAILDGMKAEDDGYKEGGIPAVTLKLALGRIASRQLKGQAKVARMVEQVGLTWSQLVSLSQTINGSKGPQEGESLGKEIIDEVVDLLYTMGKRGEKVVPIAQQLTLAPAQKVLIEASPLSVSQEAEQILNYFSGLHVIQVADYSLVEHLVKLGPVATSTIVARLEEMKQNPQKFKSLEPVPGRPGAYHQRMGTTLLFRAAIQTKDPRVIPLLKHFKQSSDSFIRREATVVLNSLDL